MKKQNNQPNPLRGLLVAGGLYNHSTATSDCSESYVNENDQDMDENNEENGAEENGEDFSISEGGDDISSANVSNATNSGANRIGLLNRKRSIGDDRIGSEINVNNNLGSEQKSSKRLRLDRGGSSESGSDRSSQMDDGLEEDEQDERVISVS